MKVFVKRSAKIDEESGWNWESMPVRSNMQSIDQEKAILDQVKEPDIDIDDKNYVVKGPRTLEDIYNRCNLAVSEPASVEKPWQF